MPLKLTGTARTTLTRVWLCNSVGCADGSADKKMGYIHSQLLENQRSADRSVDSADKCVDRSAGSASKSAGSAGKSAGSAGKSVGSAGKSVGNIRGYIHCVNA